MTTEPIMDVLDAVEGVRERPILFSAPMVRAILAGTKTQTRRVLRDQDPIDLGAFVHGAHLSRRPVFDKVAGKVIGHRLAPVSCPYGKPGDRLWVRETWQAFEHGMDVYPYIPKYRPSGAGLLYAASDCDSMGWRPSIHMPRWASRITLEITSVRVERLQSISEGDAMDEGAEPILVPPDGGSCPHVEGFRALWESINGAESWDANPYVWVVSFQRIAS